MYAIPTQIFNLPTTTSGMVTAAFRHPPEIFKLENNPTLNEIADPRVINRNASGGFASTKWNPCLKVPEYCQQ
jgi:hypothetical protein